MKEQEKMNLMLKHTLFDLISLSSLIDKMKTESIYYVKDALDLKYIGLRLQKISNVLIEFGELKNEKARLISEGSIPVFMPFGECTDE